MERNRMQIMRTNHQKKKCRKYFIIQYCHDHLDFTELVNLSGLKDPHPSQTHIEFEFILCNNTLVKHLESRERERKRKKYSDRLLPPF